MRFSVTKSMTKTSIPWSVPSCFKHFSRNCRPGDGDPDAQSEYGQHQLCLVEVVAEDVKGPGRCCSRSE